MVTIQLKYCFGAIVPKIDNLNKHDQTTHANTH